MSDSGAASPQPRGGGRSPLPQLDDLRTFVAVAEAGSLRVAAGEMFTSQPTISRAIARLEAQLGVQLLHRTPRGVQLTRHGEVLRVRATHLLRSASDLSSDVTALASGTLQFGATATSARTLLAPFLSRWMAENPDVHVTAVEDNERGLRMRLETGRCDLAIISAPVSPALATAHLVTVGLIAVFPPGHPMSQHEGPIGVHELASEPLLVNGTYYPSTDLLMRSFDRAGLQPRIVYECSAGQTLAAMAEAGMGVAVFGETASLRGFNLQRHAVLDSDGSPLRFDLYIAWLRDAVPSWVHHFAVDLSAFHHAGRDPTHREQR